MIWVGEKDLSISVAWNKISNTLFAGKPCRFLSKYKLFQKFKYYIYIYSQKQN